ncbi:MAG: tRNA (guanosine(46)-N7)-methyltransferase TrmB [Alistipes sp.]|jgi:tRNA (guanine-N7-)-methyltransferase|nr:tRNA (guanosine(46)-N7)-methyltransferase TrmB [Alistipes sp.]
MGKDKLRKFAENLTFDNMVQPAFDEMFRRDHPLKGRWGADFFGRIRIGNSTDNTSSPGNAMGEVSGADNGVSNIPLVLELGCGKGEYTVGLGAANQAQQDTTNKVQQDTTNKVQQGGGGKNIHGKNIHGKNFHDISSPGKNVLDTTSSGKNFLGIDIKGARMWRGAKTAGAMGLANVGFLRTRIEFINSFFAPGEVSEIWITFPDPQLKKGREKKRLTSPVFLAYYARFLASDGVIHLKTDSRELHDYTLRVIEANSLPLHAASADVYNDGDLQAANPELTTVQTTYERRFLAEGKPITYLRFGLGDRTQFEMVYDE